MSHLNLSVSSRLWTDFALAAAIHLGWAMKAKGVTSFLPTVLPWRTPAEGTNPAGHSGCPSPPEEPRTLPGQVKTQHNPLKSRALKGATQGVAGVPGAS